jgi:hypothetical protein
MWEDTEVDGEISFNISEHRKLFVAPVAFRKRIETEMFYLRVWVIVKGYGLVECDAI